MIRTVCVSLICLVAATEAFARLGDTLDQAEARYGLEKAKALPSGTAKLLEGSREVVFEFEGWRIRCALLHATDDKFYVVREEYTKIWNSDVMKAGGVIQIRNFERDAILKTEEGIWTPKDPAQSVPNLSGGANQLLRVFGLVDIHMRSDGATAHMILSRSLLILNLPQALNYEAQLKGIKDQPQSEQAPSVVQPHHRTVQTHQGAMDATPKPNSSSTTTSSPTISSPTSSITFPRFGSLIALGVVALVGQVLKKRSKTTRRRNTSTKPPPISAPIPPRLPPISFTPRSVRDLTWDEFELLVGEIYRRQGFTAELSAGTGADGGIDLILHRDERRILVQCKSWNVYKVSVPGIREFYGVLVSEKADRGIFITTGEFTRDAKDFAVGKPIELIDGTEFKSLLKNASNDPHDDLLNVALWAPVFLSASRVIIPPCPFCKSAMVKREGPTGAFLGCSTFPRCKGTREIRKHVRIG